MYEKKNINEKGKKKIWQIQTEKTKEKLTNQIKKRVKRQDRD